MTRVIVCVWLVSGGRSSILSCVEDRSSSTEAVLLAVGRKAHLASRRSLVLRVLELPIIHAEDAVQLVPASHLVAARRYSFYY